MADTVYDPHDASLKKTGLYVCFMCKTIEDIPDYDPDNADNDPRIGFLVGVHLRRHPSAEDREITDWCSLGVVASKPWSEEANREDIKRKILEGNGLTGFDAEFYATKDTFKADAFSCWKKHNRPSYTGVRCQDYRSDSKELKPDTAIARRVAGLPTYDEVKVRKSFLCEYCPYHSTVVSALR